MEIRSRSKIIGIDYMSVTGKVDLYDTENLSSFEFCIIDEKTKKKIPIDRWLDILDDATVKVTIEIIEGNLIEVKEDSILFGVV